MRLRFVGALVLSAMTLASCASDGSSPSTTASTPDYSRGGPSTVSVTTLDLGSAGSVLGERRATVFYPATVRTSSTGPSAQFCLKGFEYSQSETLPSAVRGALPASYDTQQVLPLPSVGCDGAGLTATPRHFPVVLFSHGYGGERLYYSHLLAGIASWGYVVVSADYLERGLASQALQGTPPPSPALDRSIMLSSLRAVVAASRDPASLLHDAVDPSKVAAAGHSAGGRTAFDALSDPRIATAIGWAPVGPTGPPAKKPTMIIGTTGDSAVTQKRVTTTFKSFPAPKALIEVSGLGHNTYTDICPGIRAGGGLINFAVANHFISPGLAKLGINGCQPKDAPSSTLWPIVQYYSVFQLRTVFAGAASSTAVPLPAHDFSSLTIAVHQQQ